MAYENPKCNKCGREIGFVSVKWYDGTIKNVPVETKTDYLLTMTEEKGEKGQFLWKSTKMAVSHKCESKQSEIPANTSETDKPPF